jgi:thiol-disulfide isomerase/thioredoxin
MPKSSADATTRRRSETASTRQRLIASAVVAAVLAGAVGLGVAVVGTSSDEPRPTQGEAAAEGERVPDLEFARFRTEQTETIHDHLGQPLIINFFASWCQPCRAEMPEFEKAHQAYGDEVAFLGLNLQDNPDSARQVIDTTCITDPVGTDSNGQLFQALGGTGMPTTLFVAADGTITEHFTGQLTAAGIQKRLTRYNFIDR